MDRGCKCAVFTSIRQARPRSTSEPIRIVMVVGGWGGETVRVLQRPSGHITGLPLITSCHIDENSVKGMLTDVQYVCKFVCVRELLVVP